MKVVLFCGGLGLRIRDYAENIPKPMIPIGYRPILWHVMKIFEASGYDDFIICCGSSPLAAGGGIGHRRDAIFGLSGAGPAQRNLVNPARSGRKQR